MSEREKWRRNAIGWLMNMIIFLICAFAFNRPLVKGIFFVGTFISGLFTLYCSDKMEKAEEEKNSNFTFDEKKDAIRYT